MLKFYENLLHQFGLLHADILKAIDALPPEGLDWRPAPGMNSLTVIVVHLSGAERYWIGDVVMGVPSFRDRDWEFTVKGWEPAALKQRILDLEAYEKTAFEKMGLPDLQEERISPRDGQTVLVGEAFMHALKHTAVHLGHIEILLQQWKIRNPETKKK
jgi:uncharacterized damage-inducible protein DinB